MRPNVQQRRVDEITLRILEAIDVALEEAAMSECVQLDYVRLVAVQAFTDDELRFALGLVN